MVSMEPANSRFTANYASEEPMKWGPKKILGIVVLVIAAIAVWTYVGSPMIVTVTGSGEVSVPATNATVSFTLSSSDASAQNAVGSVNAKALTVRTFLEGQGITSTDIAESQVTVVPAGLVSAGATGYQATISMAAKTTHVSTISSLISSIYTQGALVVTQPVLSVENQDKLEQTALDSAMKDAKSQAAKIALSNWKLFRKVVAVSQVSSPTTSTSTTKADTLTGANSQVAATNGVFKIVKAVSVSYKMW